MHNYRDYYNYNDNNYNQPNYNQQNQTYSNLYDPYQGFIRGNMFNDLYNSYRLDKPVEIIPNNEQAELLTYIDALTFALNDLNLYLDLNPNDKQLIEMFRIYSAQNKEYVRTYENKYGPLSVDSDNLNANYWDWIDMPWPWEGGK